MKMLFLHRNCQSVFSMYLLCSDHDIHGKVSTDLCTDIKLTVHESERETNVMQCLLPSYPHEQYKKK